MVAHQPDDGVRLLLGQAETRAKRAGDFAAHLAVVARLPLGHVVQEDRDIQRSARMHFVNDFRGDGGDFGEAARLDPVQLAHAEDGVFIHRVVVVHVVLHLRHDAPERGHEATQDARLVHPAQRRLRVLPRGQDVQEHPVRFGVGAQVGVDPLQVLGDPAQRARMDVQVVLLRRGENAQHPDGIVGERLAPVHREPVALDRKPGDVRVAAQGGQAEARPAPVVGLQLGAHDPGELAHVLGDQIVRLHQALDGAHARVVAIAHAPGDFALEVEGEPLLAAPGEIVKVAAQGPEEVVRLVEAARLVGAEHLQLDQPRGIVHPVDVLGDPEQRGKVAQAALALLHVGLELVARIAQAPVAGVALGELALDKRGDVAGPDLAVVAPAQLVEEVARAPEEARFEHAGVDGQITLGAPDGVVDRARGVAHFEAQIPQEIQDFLDDLLAPRGDLVGQQEEQIDVRRGRQLAAPVAAHRGDGEVLARRGVGFRVQPAADVRAQRGQQGVHEVAGLAHDARARGGLRLEARADCGAAIAHGRLQDLQGGAAAGRVRAVFGVDRGELRVQRRAVEDAPGLRDFDVARRGEKSAVHVRSVDRRLPTPSQCATCPA